MENLTYLLTNITNTSQKIFTERLSDAELVAKYCQDFSNYYVQIYFIIIVLLVAGAITGRQARIRKNKRLAKATEAIDGIREYLTVGIIVFQILLWWFF